MRMRFYGLVGLSLFVLVCAGGHVHAQGVTRSWSLDERFLERLRVLPDEVKDFSKVLFEISDRAQKDLLGERQSAGPVFRKLVKSFKSSATGRSCARKCLAALNAFLFDRERFRSDRSRLFESSLDALIFSKVLAGQKGNCLSLSLLYFSFTRELKIMVSPVVAPRHVFLKQVTPEGGFNIETTARASNPSDEYYLKEFFVCPQGKQCEPRVLTSKEFLGLYLANLANHYKLKGFEDKAIAIYMVAIDMLSGYAPLYINLGNAYERLGELILAKAEYERALSLDPYLCEAYYNLGLLHFVYTKRFALARRYGTIARDLGCRFHPEFRAFFESGKFVP